MEQAMRLMNTLTAVALGTALAVAAQQPGTPSTDPASPPKTSKAGKSTQPEGSPKAKSKSEAKATAQSGVDPKQDPSTKWLTSGNPQADAMDKSADPCEDFYQYACGGWMKVNPLPADKARYGRFTELLDHNQLVLKNILEKAAAGGAKRTATDQKIGDYYGSCMDETTVNSLGLKPVQADLKRVDTLTSKGGLTDLLIYLHGKTIPGLFRFGSTIDPNDATRVIADTDQGGLSLPTVDYYLDDSPRMKDIRAKYLTHVANMLKFAGYPYDNAQAGAQAVLNIETALAKVSLTPVERRNPKIQVNPMTIVAFQQKAPAIEWAKYIQGVGTPKVDSLNVSVPKFAEGMTKLVADTNLDDIKTYLKWHVLHDAAPFLDDKVVNENFDFFGKTLSGQQQLEPRWKRCVTRTDTALGEALGIAYVDRTFGADGKAITVELVKGIEDAMQSDIDTLDWMGPETKGKALEKLRAIANKIGYPEKWRDYSSVKIVRGDFLGNETRSAQFEKQRQLNKIGKPVDKKEWGMTPPTVNAYYNPQENNINFPAGILQQPFFNKGKDDALNYGGIGVVVGHELTHGFDDQGSQFDAQGNLKDWWTENDRKKFDELEGCFVEEYNGFVAVPEKDGNPAVNVNGKLTLGENTADNGGMRLAWMALMDKYKRTGQKPEMIDGMTPEQRFFLGFAQVWCENATDNERLRRAKGDPHSPGRYRANGTIRNMPEFAEAYKCKPGSFMAPEKRCKSW
jgi:endothelin-converting enzyme/putative endopeptidase